MSYRNTTDEDIRLLDEVILHRWDMTYGRLHAPNIEKAKAHIYNKHLEGEAYIVDESYLLLTSTVSLWFADDKLLLEEIVLSINDTGNINLVVKALEDIAKKNNCSGVLLGDSSIERRLGKIYSRRHGYSLVTNQFYKEL